MLFLENGKWIQKPFSPGYYSRNQIPFDYIPGAKCERFENEVLIRNLDPEDADLLQLYAGQVLLGYNYAQKFIIIHGVAKSSKSTFLNILKGIVGQSNTAELRTWLLNERFETSRFIGKQLLYGADVPGDFLNCEGASAIKRLTGGDEIETEHKGRNATVIIKGCFNVVIVSNSRLVVMMDGDKTPWQRRLILIDFPKPITSSPIPNFDKLLIETEGSGILNWMLAGAEKLMTDIKEGRGFVMTPEQIERVENLLYESDSVRAFAREKIVVCQNADVSTEEISTAYVDFCENKGWDAIPQRKFETSIPDAMLELYRISKSSNLTRNGKRCRGYVGVRIRSNNPEMQEQETEW
jgi:P4 family phage/plasmid primase-like protien